MQVPPKIIDRYVNLLVLGESGLGKTTFIKNCFADLSQEPFELRDASGASMQVGRWALLFQHCTVAFWDCACHTVLLAIGAVLGQAHTLRAWFASMSLCTCWARW